MYVAAFRFLGFSEPESNRLANERLGHVRFSSYTIAASSNYLEIGYFYFCYFLQWQKKDNLSVYVRPVLLTPMQQYLHGLFPDLRGQREQAIPSIRDLVDGVAQTLRFYAFYFVRFNSYELCSVDGVPDSDFSSICCYVSATYSAPACGR